MLMFTEFLKVKFANKIPYPKIEKSDKKVKIIKIII